MKNIKKICIGLTLFIANLIAVPPPVQAAPLLQLYSQGCEVEILQQMLQKQGYHLSINGHFD